MRLAALFAERAAARRKVLVAYVCVGYPDVEASIDLARACVEGGADVLELGVPFSDPTADGPRIARASLKAITAGGGLEATLGAARQLRDAAPLVLFGYYNPLFVRGEARSVDDAADAGIDGLLVVDLPLEEGTELRDRAAARGVSVIPLLTPTSTAGRLELVRGLGKERAGFTYYVSVTGVTGIGDAPLAEASQTASRFRARHGIPTVVGFGIDSPAKAVTAGAHVDGVVVGTKLVSLIDEATTHAARRTKVTSFVKELRDALDAT